MSLPQGQTATRSQQTGWSKAPTCPAHIAGPLARVTDCMPDLAIQSCQPAPPLPPPKFGSPPPKLLVLGAAAGVASCALPAGKGLRSGERGHRWSVWLHAPDAGRSKRPVDPLRWMQAVWVGGCHVAQTSCCCAGPVPAGAEKHGGHRQDSNLGRNSKKTS